jgi:hypothetical protein
MGKHMRYAFSKYVLPFACGALILAAYAPAPAQAAGLTAPQVSAILVLLQSFGADQATVARVQAALGGTAAAIGAPGSVSFAAGTQPRDARVAPGTKLAPFTSFSLSNRTGSAVEIYGITVNREGTGSDSYVSQIELFDASGAMVGEGAQLDRSHQAIVGATFTLMPGETKALTIVGSIASRNKVQSDKTLSLEVVSINASGALSGSLPITGATYTTDRTLKP